MAQLGPGASLITSGGDQAPPAREHKALGDFLKAHRLMCFAWAMAGADIVPSKVSYDQAMQQYRQVHRCHLGDALGYHWFVAGKANQFGLSSPACLEWVMAKDLRTLRCRTEAVRRRLAVG